MKSRNITIKKYASQAKSSTHLSRTPAIMRVESLDAAQQPIEHYASIGVLDKIRVKNQ
jgi:hypothetical protein